MKVGDLVKLSSSHAVVLINGDKREIPVTDLEVVHEGRQLS